MKSSTSKDLQRPLFVEFGGQDTRRNLPKAVARKCTETNFLRSFERAYFTEEVGIALAGREFTLQGFGRADLVWLAWTGAASPKDFTALALKKRIRLTAIEAKMSDWRKGLQQAPSVTPISRTAPSWCCRRRLPPSLATSLILSGSCASAFGGSTPGRGGCVNCLLRDMLRQ